MAMQFLSSRERPLNFEKFRKNPKKSNLKSFWAFLLSILIYISIFYVFNLSPSTLLCTTKFWFFISNTLILIIAADFGAFSSSEKRDSYDDYVKNNVRTNDSPSYNETKYKKIVEETAPSFDQRKELVDEKIIDMVVPYSFVADQNRVTNKPEFPSIKEERVHREINSNEKFGKNKKEIISFSSTLTTDHQDGRPGKKMRKSKCVRSNSERATLLLSESHEERMVLRRTSSERYDEPRYEENEYSSLSNEELNRRVEEFIRKFNRQMRLQAVGTNTINPEIHRI